MRRSRNESVAPRRTVGPADDRVDRLKVRSVEKAFRVLAAFNAARPSLSLSQIAAAVDLDKSAAQRYAHTLTQLGYLRKNLQTTRLELTAKTLSIGYSYVRSSPLLERAMPYLQHLSQETQETINLTVLDDNDIVFVSRFPSRHVLNMDVMVGARMPAYCTAPGIAMLSRLQPTEAKTILRRSDLKPYTASTTWKIDALMKKLADSAARGYATAFEEFYHGDLSIAAAVLDSRAHPLCALNIAVSRARFTSAEAEARFSPLVVSAAVAVSQSVAAAGRTD